MRLPPPAAALAVMIVSSPLFAQTPELIRGLGAMNAANFAAPGLPASGVAPGARFVLFGRALGPAEPLTQETAVETSLGGVSVSVTSGGSTVEAFVMSVAANRIEAMLPLHAALGTGTVTVQVSGEKLTANIRVVERAFGIRTFGPMGLGPAMLTEPARPGALARLRGTGLGSEQSPDGIEVLVAGVAVPAAGVTRLASGWEEIDFEIPADAPSGCGIAVAVRHGSTVSNYASVATASDCALPGVEPASVRTGQLSLVRSASEWSGIRASTDVGLGWFQRGPDGITEVPLLGQGCTVYYTIEQDPPSRPVTPFDAGRLELSGPDGVREIARQSKGSYSSLLGQLTEGSDVPATPGNGLFLAQGEYTFSGSGGEDVGAFTARLSVPAPLVWVNTVASLERIDRASDLTIEWRDSTAGQVVTVSGFAMVPGSRPLVGAGFTCLERGDKERLTVPSYILSALPATTSSDADGMITIGANALRPAEFTAPGLDRPGTADYSQSVSRQTRYR